MFQRPSAVLFMAAFSTRAFAAPLQYLTGASARAEPVVWLTWGVLLISVGVMVIIAGLLLGAICAAPGGRRTNARLDAGQRRPFLAVDRRGAFHPGVAVHGGMDGEGAGRKSRRPPASPPSPSKSPAGNGGGRCVISPTIPAQQFATANEIHIPVGPAGAAEADGRRRHSFFLGAAAGGQDGCHSRPDQRDLDRSATARHLLRPMHRILRPAARPYGCCWWSRETPAGFRGLVGAPAGRDRQVAAGSRISKSIAAAAMPCAARRRRARFGPDLSHLMQRRTLAAGVLPNDPATWRTGSPIRRASSPAA